ncbi:hypothetical protein LINGRAHAP2_LOCUS34693 [Linum grandiflorum]
MAILDAKAMAHELRRMALLDEGRDVTVPDAATDAEVDDYTLCALGTFVTEWSINFNAMRTQMANLWKPHEGISISDKALGNALGSFLTYDEYNMYLDKNSCMHLRVKLDVRKSLLREKEVKKPSSSIMVTFKYEKLPIFCFLCGRIGHIDRACAVRFHFARNTELPLLWDASLRAQKRRILKEIKESDATSVLLGLATDVIREGAVEVVDDQKRRKGNDHDEADMEVDTENALKLAINNDSTRAQPGTTKGCTKQLSIT